MKNGPRAYTHEERMQRAWEIAGKVQRHYGERTLAIGVYGSLAHGTDGPYSDIEMHVIIEGEKLVKSFEWSAGPWKAEVDVYSPDEALAAAAEFDDDWPITHGAYVHVLPFYDPQGFFPHMREAVFSHTAEQFRNLMALMIIGDVYECVGKVRNAITLGKPQSLAAYTLEMARHGACLVGLHNRTLYTSGPSVLPESLELPNRPAGYGKLCRMVMAGDLGEAKKILKRVNALWSGIEAWAAELNLPIQSDLDQLLASDQ